jgi:hypothetical protein
LALDNPDEYRAKAQQCLKDGEGAALELRLQLITIAQRWYELAEQTERLDREQVINQQRNS